MRTFETTAVVEDENSLHLDHPMEKSITGKVHVIIVSDDEEITEHQWLQAAANNPAYSFLKDPLEDVYTLEDGIPWNGGSKV